MSKIELRKRASDLRGAFIDAYAKLKIDEKTRLRDKLEAESAKPELWNNPNAAKAKMSELAALTDLVAPWQTLKFQIDDLDELVGLSDPSLEAEISEQLRVFEETFAELRGALRFTGTHDAGNAILRITSGVGGVDAADFAEMLERMYLRYAERQGFETDVLERSPGEEAGVKTAVISVTGPYAYGKLRGENGVHRLVRLSPFNSDHLRQTSFALVEVLPELSPEAVRLDPKDLKIDVYRAGGHGGQSVNTTDSAVRITHIPTGITVAIQNERSQLQNKETALKVLASKLAALQEEQNAADLANLRAGKSADWGSQIRNYVLHPYKLVKDTRTKHEENDAEKVLDGAIEGFINAWGEYELGK